jgi:hypothetical protein
MKRRGGPTRNCWSASIARCAAIAKVMASPRGIKLLRQLYGIVFHDVYHAGQIRLLRRLMKER